jgi:hypothetical protein
LIKTNKNADLKGRRSLEQTELQYLSNLAVHGFQALRAQMHALGAAINHHRAHRNIGAKLTIGMPLGETHVVTVLRTFTAALTLCH